MIGRIFSSSTMYGITSSVQLQSNFPRSGSAHFYVDVTPRMAVIAGFELNTGTFVEIMDPADAARRLREIP